MSTIPLGNFLVVSTVVFSCGVIGVLFRHNLIMMLMSIELMLNGVNLAFVAASKHYGQLDGQVMMLFVVTVAACEAGVGLAMVIALFRKYGTINTDFLRLLRG